MTHDEVPMASKPQPEQQTSSLLVPPKEPAKGHLGSSSKHQIDYSCLRIGEDKSFMEFWDEAYHLNEDNRNEELLTLGDLKNVHNVSSFTFHCNSTFPYVSSPQVPVCGILWQK